MTALKGGDENVGIDRKLATSILDDLVKTSSHLANAASSLADQAVPVSVPVKARSTAIPVAGLPAAKVLSVTAVQIARAAPVAAAAAPVFAPAVNR